MQFLISNLAMEQQCHSTQRRAKFLSDHFSLPQQKKLRFSISWFNDMPANKHLRNSCRKNGNMHSQILTHTSPPTKTPVNPQ